MKDISNFFWIHSLNYPLNHNNFYILREDLIPFSFGGNKLRKGILFFEDMKKKNADCVVTYGSSSSNHCRIIANLAYKHDVECFVITPEEEYKETYNSNLINVLNGKYKKCSIDSVSAVIDHFMTELLKQGRNPYFIQGGGHGNIGTRAYQEVFQKIQLYEQEYNKQFDYIFLASGTGTTQAGLVCGQYINGDFEKSIIGISVARKKDYGTTVIINSVEDYLNSLNIIPMNALEIKQIARVMQKLIHFSDEFIGDGYGIGNEAINQLIVQMFAENGIPLDSTYTGKAFWGMSQYLQRKNIFDKNVLFIHTGGTPLFFDHLLAE